MAKLHQKKQTIMYCGTDYMQCYTVYAKAQISITVYRTTLLTMSLPGLRKFSYLLIWCGVTKYYLVLLKCLLLRNFFMFSACSQTRGHQYKLFNHNASRLRAAFFSERIINTWNSLPESVVNFSSLSRFRRSIQKVDFSSFLRCF